MSDGLVQTANQHNDAVCRERDELAEQIRKGQESIARSQELIKRMDAILTPLDSAKR